MGIEDQVMERYPVLPTEARCALERNCRNRARDSYRIKLMALEKERQDALQSKEYTPVETVGEAAGKTGC